MTIYEFIRARLAESTDLLPGRDHLTAIVDELDWLTYMPNLDCRHTDMLYGIAALWKLHPEFDPAWTPNYRRTTP